MNLNGRHYCYFIIIFATKFLSLNLTSCLSDSRVHERVSSRVHDNVSSRVHDHVKDVKGRYECNRYYSNSGTVNTVIQDIVD